MTSTISPPLPPPTNRQKRPHLNPPFSVKSVNNPANLQQHIHFIILHIIKGSFIGSGKVYLQVNIFTQLLLNAVGLTFILSSISLYAQLSHNLSKYVAKRICNAILKQQNCLHYYRLFMNVFSALEFRLIQTNI